jgi:D-glycero-alpha-D-manno-heptose-7-phosphate kinase
MEERKENSYKLDNFDRVVRSRAPVRIYFGGGGTDISPYTEEKGGAVLSAAISKYTYGTLIPTKNNNQSIASADYKQALDIENSNELNFEGDLKLIKAVIKRANFPSGFKLFLRGDIPPNTGLGSSATAAVTLLGLFNHLKKGRKFTKYELSELAFKIEEEDLKNVGGRQDQYATTFGGINLIEFKGNDFVRVSPLKLKKNTLLELQKRLILAYIGKRERSGELLEEQKKSYSLQEKIDCLDSLKQNVYKMCDALEEEDFEQFGKLISDSWEKKVKLNPNITTPRIEELRKLALKNGAIGARNMGAGRGGHMIFLCEPNKEHIVAKKLEQAGAKIIDFTFDHEGLVTWDAKKESSEVLDSLI